MKYTKDELDAMSGRKLEALWDTLREGTGQSGATIRKKEGPAGLVQRILESASTSLGAGGPLPPEPGDNVVELTLHQSDPNVPVGDKSPDRFKALAKTTRRLPVPLTHPEWENRAARLAQVEDEVSNEQEYQKQVKADLKARMSRLEAERSQVALAVRQKIEMRDVGVEFLADFHEGIVREQRMDDGTVLSTRSLTAEERQPTLFE